MVFRMLVAAVLSLLLTNISMSSATAQATSAQTTLKVWTWGTIAETMDKHLNPMFEALNPDIKIETVEVQGSMAGLTLQIVGGVGPDVFLVRAESMQAFIHQGLVADLTPLFERDLDLDMYLPSWGPVYSNGKYYGVPFEGGGYRTDAMYVNRDIFANAGINPPGPEIHEALSFNAWTELARKLTIDRDADGTPEQWGTHFRTSRWYYFVPCSGLDVFSANWADTNIDKPEVIEVLDYLQKALVVHKISAPDSYWFETKGNVAMNILWRARLAVMPETIGDKFDYSVAPIPAGKGGSVGLTVMNPLAINPHTKNIEAAWRYLLFTLSEPSQRLQAQEGRAVTLKSVALDRRNVYFDRPPYNIMGFLGGNAADIIMQFEPPGVSRPQAVTDALAKLWRGEIPAQSAARQMADAWRKALSGRAVIKG